MKREVNYANNITLDDGTKMVAVVVTMDKQERERLIEEYDFLMERRILAGDFIAPLQLVQEILQQIAGL
jgi:hypothetical protein